MGKVKRKFRILLGIFHTYRNPFLPVLDHFRLLKKKERTILLRNGFKFKVRTGTSDIKIITELLIHKVYNKILSNKDFDSEVLVVDIGAHIGVFSVVAASKFKKGKVFCFEPLPANYKLLRENIRTNALKGRVFAVQKAISARTGKSVLLGNYDDTGGGSLYLSGNSSFAKVKTRIETVTLPDIFRIFSISHIDLLKLDCEGCEYEIFYATPKEYLQEISEMIIEYHTHTFHCWYDEKEKLKNYLYPYFDIEEFSNYIYAKQK